MTKHGRTSRSHSSLHVNQGYNKKSQDLVDAHSAKTKCFGYKTNYIKTFFYCLLNLVLVGAPFLFCRWYVQWNVYLRASPTYLRNATTVLILEDDEYFECAVQHSSIDFLPNKAQRDGRVASQGIEDVEVEEETSERTPLTRSALSSSKNNFRHFIFRHEHYFWDDQQGYFRKLEGLESVTTSDLLESYPGLLPDRRLQLQVMYGANVINVEVKSYLALLFEEVLNPFYVFQIGSVILWCFDDYYYYAVCVIVISCISIVMSLVETRRQMESLREMAMGHENLVVAVRTPQGAEDEICAQELVPGDVIFIPPEGMIMPCDAVVLNGSCIVNESMLTGESVPVRKTPVAESNEFYDSEVHKRHTIFAGTQVIQTRFYGGNKVCAVVVRTGFATLKGGLIRSMLFPKKSGLDFYADAMRFVGVLFCIALCGMTYCLQIYFSRHASFKTILIRVLDIVTIVVPPALPAALTVGTVYAQARLKLRDIFCISPPKINSCGKLQLICFDKTGTLTEDGLDFAAVVPTLEADEENNNMRFGDAQHDVSFLPPCSPIGQGMATCHSLTYIKGNLVGDPLDLKMFEATGWELVEPLSGADEERFDVLTPTYVKKRGTEIGIIREFEFTPQLQRMSVVVKPLESSSMTVYCKGSPEKVSVLCSELPEDYDLVLDSYTVKGYRVLALARKIITRSWVQVQRASREMIESDLIFTGFLIMQNSLKEATIPVIRELRHADIRSVMVTGDNALTALSVARECGMIPSCDKVVIVNAHADGEIEYTLAAHHYEAGETASFGGSQRRRLSHMTKTDSSSSECPASFLPSEGSIRSESASDQSADEDDRDSNDSRIDMDRLIPIQGGERYSADPEFVTMDSNYHFVVTGRTWDILFRCHPKMLLHRILAKGTVYARMSPEWKQQLVESLQGLGYVTAMCGDGANDCSALKTAHVGISLSEAEASVAAPFTSKTPDISCVPHLIREGRCALVTSFGMFKYMALYSLVQFITVLSLYRLGSNLSDAEFLYIDLIITTTLAIVMGRTEPYDRIIAKRPIGNLASFQNILSILSQIFITAGFQIGALIYLQAQPWYVEVEIPTGDDMQTLCWENSVLFCISGFQYLILALVFSSGPPFRKPFYTNGYFVVTLAVLTTVNLVLTAYPYEWIADFVGLMPLDPTTTAFRLSLLLFPFMNLIFSLAIEMLLLMSGPVKGIRIFRRTRPLYQEVMQEMEEDPYWPRVKS